MDTIESRHKNNEDYLSTALRWLRLRLIRLTQGQQASLGEAPTAVGSDFIPDSASTSSSASALTSAQASASGSSGASTKAFSAAGQSSSGPDNPAGDALSRETAQSDTSNKPNPSNMTLDEQCAQASTEMAALENINPPPALITLSRRFGLSRFEQETLLLCVAMELDTRIERLCAMAQGDHARNYPTFALALTLFDDPAWEVLSPTRPLRYWHFLEIARRGTEPLTTSPLMADERAVNYVKGLNCPDGRLGPLLTSIRGDWEGEPLSDSGLRVARENGLPPSQRRLLDTILLNLRAAHRNPPVVQLLGPDSSSKRSIALRAAAEFGLGLYRLSADALPSQWSELEVLTRLLKRESLLLPLAVYIDAYDTERGPALLKHAIPRIGTFVFLDTREPWTGLTRDTLPLHVAKPTPAEQKIAWEASLSESAGDNPGVLANQFNLSVADIRRISHTATHQRNGRPSHRLLWEACLRATRPRMNALTQQLEPKAAWGDLVLPEPQKEQMRRIVAQVQERRTVYDEWGFERMMNRGLGINALFVGESGTGKTMAAEVIAHELKLDLYRIDLSAVVSKYIGETEKNLRRVFDASEDGGAILFFDEADALFGKRSEVKDSHDRYANIEINYLLQRMEAYRGLAILATNMKSALDQAFMRRLRFIVNFPFPEATERELIWRKVFPDSAPVEGLDCEFLSGLSLTGGSIHNISINAAFLAAQAKESVTMHHVMEAARSEFRKLEKPTNEADFRWPGSQ